eukprot:151035-Chlamydomonas_euryale.AAC.2
MMYRAPLLRCVCAQQPKRAASTRCSVHMLMTEIQRQAGRHEVHPQSRPAEMSSPRSSVSAPTYHAAP